MGSLLMIYHNIQVPILQDSGKEPKEDGKLADGQ